MKVVKYVLIPLLLVSCDGDKDYQKALDNEVKYGLIMHFIMNYKPTSVIDMKNGSVKAITYDGDKYFLMKKCLQGQVYRQAENGCQGTGSESDNYGAVRLQYCDTADNSCNGKNGSALDNTGNSEAYKSCDSETTLGIKWKVPSIFYDIFRSPYRETIYSHIVSKDLKLWTSYSSSYNSELAECVNCGESNRYNDGRTYENKTNRNYVLCSSHESFIKE